jgi:polyhydroxyalkanoate synthase
VENSLDQWVMAAYAAGSAGVRRWLADVSADAATRAKLEFAAEQWLAAMHPDNFLATNPEAIRRAVETGGGSLSDGLRLMSADFARGRVSNTDDTGFEVGRNLAITPGAVVMRNRLVELIQYRATTPTVGARPLLIVPPCINKFYILDLQPDNSFVGHCLAAGHTVFMVSWRNPGAAEADLTWDDYLRMGVVDTLAAARAISRSATVNALGFCVGGTILATALAALAARGERPVASLTLLATLLDFSDAGPLGVFVDPATVAYREAALARGGILPGAELAGAFSALRPRDLVWNYVSNGYLKGEKPPAFDLLYWNADSTNLPGPMYCWYLRNMYLENRLREPGGVRSLGEAVDLATVDLPSYIVATREDHIVPWRSAFASTRLLSGKKRFVLGASGHIAGIVNPPARRRRSFWHAAWPARARAVDADAWLATATETPGSWWSDWSGWLGGHAGRKVTAPEQPGNAKFPPLAVAPGEYVKVRI